MQVQIKKKKKVLLLYTKHLKRSAHVTKQPITNLNSNQKSDFKS